MKGSNIPEARRLLKIALAKHAEAQVFLDQALKMMTRKQPKRRAPGVPEIITEKMREQVWTLRRENPSMTMHEIADEVGLRNVGRVSEILDGQR